MADSARCIYCGGQHPPYQECSAQWTVETTGTYPAPFGLTAEQVIEALRATHEELAGRPMVAREEQYIRFHYYIGQGYSILDLCQRALALLKECHDAPGSILPLGAARGIRAVLSEAEEHGVLPRT